MTNKQPEALRLANELEKDITAYSAAIENPDNHMLRMSNAAAELRRLHELNEDLYQQGVGFIARIDALEQALGVVVKALEEIVEWTERYTTPGHPISTIGRAALVKAQGDNNANG